MKNHRNDHAKKKSEKNRIKAAVITFFYSFLNYENRNPPKIIFDLFSSLNF